MEPILSINGCKCTQACPFFSRSSLKKEPLHHWLLWKGEQQLWAHCGSTNPSLIWTTSILLPAPTLHSVLSFSLLPSPQFSPPPPLAILILTLPPPPASSPPKVLLEIYPISFSSSGQNRKGTGSNKTEQQGWDGSSKVIKPRTQTHGSPQGHWGETPGGVGGHFCLCVICWGRHFMCSRWEGWTTRPPTFFSAPTNSAWYLLRLISRNVSF